MPWLEATALGTWMRESPSIWAYPTILTLHTVGLGIVVGASAVIDFRLLGFAPRDCAAVLSPLFRIMVWAFVLNAATGMLLFMSDATTKSTQPVVLHQADADRARAVVTRLVRRGIGGRADRRDRCDCAALAPAGGRCRWCCGRARLPRVA